MSTALVAPQTRPSGSFAQPSIVRYGLGRSAVSFACGTSSAAARQTAAQTCDDMGPNYTRRVTRWVVALLVAGALSGAAWAQDVGFRGFGFRGRFRIYPNTPYDGRFTFVRVRYNHLPGGDWYGGWPAWSHGYPIAEQNLMRIMNEVSYLGAHADEVNELTFDDPELLKYPVA